MERLNLFMLEVKKSVYSPSTSCSPFFNNHRRFEVTRTYPVQQATWSRCVPFGTSKRICSISDSPISSRSSKKICTSNPVKTSSAAVSISLSLSLSLSLSPVVGRNTAVAVNWFATLSSCSSLSISLSSLSSSVANRLSSSSSSSSSSISEKISSVSSEE